MLLVVMGKSYCHASTDPAYLEGCTHVCVRIQRANVEVRMATLRSMGKYGNQDAAIAYVVETANEHVLFHRFKLYAAMANSKLDIRMFSCVLDGNAAEARAIELLQKTTDEKNWRVQKTMAVLTSMGWVAAEDCCLSKPLRRPMVCYHPRWLADL